MLIRRPGAPPLSDEARGSPAASGFPRLYVKDADTRRPVEIRSYTSGLPAEDLAIAGPVPLRLVITMPRPKCSGIERLRESDAVRAYSRTLQHLPVRHAFVTVMGQELGVVQIADAPDPAPDPERANYIEAVRRAHGQSAADIQATDLARETAIADLRSGQRFTQEEGDDGSLR